MSNTFQTQLRGITNVNEIMLNQSLNYSVRAFYNWGLLGIGAFWNVNIPTSGVYGGDFSRLRPVNDPYYDFGQVWETPRTNWVYESGVNYSVQPISISGVWVNGSFYGSGDSTYSHNLDYVLGRIIFDNPVDSSNTIQMNYSFKWVSFHEADSEWFKEIMYDTMRVDAPDMFSVGSGSYEILSRSRVQLPAIIVENIPKRNYKPLQLGGGQTIYQDLAFNIITETKADRDKLLDIIGNQNNISIGILDYTNILNSGVFPLNGDNAINQNGLPYTYFLTNNTFYSKKARFIDTSFINIGTVAGLYVAIVKTTCEIDMPEI